MTRGYFVIIGYFVDNGKIVANKYSEYAQSRNDIKM